MPKNSATMQHTKPAIPLLLELLPAVPSAMPLTMMPTPAKGILSQFSEPRHGKNPTTIPTIARIPQSKLSTCRTLPPFVHSMQQAKGYH